MVEKQVRSLNFGPLTCIVQAPVNMINMIMDKSGHFSVGFAGKSDRPHIVFWKTPGERVVVSYILIET
ncbi:hypothetical protein K100096D8_01560 [Eggerthella lenta]